ncbi:MAG: nitroreductase [Chloroflexi bacterium]|nr:nitroreductase [Chloroflexota bacterium]
MELCDAIHTRLSIGKVKPDPVPRELIEKMLSAAVQAPNHHKVRPWRFVVLTGQARERLGDVFAASFRKRHPEAMEEAVTAARGKALRSPVLIVVGVDKPVTEKVVELENVCAAAAAAQNLLLAAHGLGLAAKWNTGDNATDDLIKAFFGLAPDQHLLGFIHIGYPMVRPQAVERPSFEDRTVWME